MVSFSDMLLKHASNLDVSGRGMVRGIPCYLLVVARLHLYFIPHSLMGVLLELFEPINTDSLRTRGRAVFNVRAIDHSHLDSSIFS